MTFTLAIFVIVVCSAEVLRRLFLQPLRAVPGPFIARISDLWYCWAVNKGDFERTNIKLHKKYGPIVRYGPNRFSINDPEAAGVIYGLGSKLPKSSWYSSWGPPGHWTIFSDQDIHHHAQVRKLYSNTYSMSSLISYEPFVDEATDIFHQRLQENYAFDVIGLITYSKRLGFLDHGQDIGGVIAALEDHLTYATLVGVFPAWHAILTFVRTRLFCVEKGKGREYVINFTREQVESFQESRKPASATGLEEPDGVESFLSKFQAKHAASPKTFTKYHIVVGLAANMVAGSDTTAISLSAILYYLLKSESSLKRLKEEIATFSREGKLSEKPTFKESQAMPYLQAVIKEALRMHPATGLPLERVVPEGGITIANTFFPKGTIVGINSWVEHHDVRIFGRDADKFRPERWLNASANDLSYMNRHWIPFGLDSRSCIGRHISLLEISKLVPRILRDFDFSLVDGSSSASGTWSTRNMWFVKPYGVMTRIYPRTQLRSSQG